MGSSQVILTILRVLVVVVAVGVVGVGVWAKFIIRDIEDRGFAILAVANLESPAEDASWRAFMRTAIDTQLRLWIAIAAGAFSTLATLLVTLSLTIPRLRLPTPFLLPFELLSSLSLAVAFAAALSLSLEFPPTLPNAHSSADLASFAMLPPLARGYAIAAGTGTFFSLASTMSFLVQTIHRVRDSKACSFEPTASAPGMGYDYAASTGDTPQSGDEEKGLAGAAADMGKLESEVSQSGSGKEKEEEEEEVSWPLAAVKKTQAADTRPHRPWSELPKK